LKARDSFSHNLTILYKIFLECWIFRHYYVPNVLERDMMTLAETIDIKLEATSFPAQAVEAILTERLCQVAKQDAALKGITLPADKAHIARAKFELDSLIVVTTLCVLDELVGFDVSEKVVKSGGYNSVAEAVAHVLPNIHKEWKRRKGYKP
jgi:hypothetical protein